MEKHRTIQWYLKTDHQLDLSVGAIVQAIHGVARQAPPAVREVLERIRPSGGAGRRNRLAPGGVQRRCLDPDGIGAPPPNNTSYVGVGIRGWWIRCWTPLAGHP